jgi:ATP-dependent Clp protease ATP-binding subunit ClpA
MNVSPSIELIWQLAAREAVMGSFKEIEPEHLLAAVFKFSEVTDEELRSMAATQPDVIPHLSAGRGHLRFTLVAHGVPSTTARHRLRERLGDGGAPYAGGEIHRSPRARAVFDAAQRFAREAGAECVDVQHLLQGLIERPTPAIVEILPHEMFPPRASPALNLVKYARDLTDLVTRHRSTASAPSSGEPSPPVSTLASRAATIASALIDVLGHDVKGAVMLIASDGELLTSAMLKTAERLLVPSTLPIELRGRRLMEIVVTRLVDRTSNPQEIIERLAAVFEEGRAVTDTGAWGRPILYLSDLTDRLIGVPPIAAALMTAIRASGTPCLYALSPGAYERYIRPRHDWGQLHVMWLRSPSELDVPSHL